jgi:hypothetical protein
VFTYVVYGLGVRSAVELPELTRGSGPTEVDVRVGPVPDAPRDEVTTGGALRVTPEHTCLYFRNTGAIRVRAGREITIDPDPGADPATLRACVLGPALGLLLHQRGLLVLHASAVVLGDGVVAFLGRSGQGKSTTAAALHVRGCGVIADDVVAVDLTAPGGPVVRPGYPQLKLWPDAVTALGERPDALSRVVAREEKRARAVTAPPEASWPLHRVYVLTDDEALALDPLAGHAAVFELVQHSYIAPALPRLGSAHDLTQCIRLATTVPVRRLRRPRSLAGLDRLATLVERDAGPVAAFTAPA